MLLCYLYPVVSKRYPMLLSLLALACINLDERDSPRLLASLGFPLQSCCIKCSPTLTRMLGVTTGVVLTQCVFCLYTKGVSYYDLSVLSMSVVSNKIKSFDGRWVGGVSSIQVCFGFFEFFLTLQTPLPSFVSIQGWHFISFTTNTNHVGLCVLSWQTGALSRLTALDLPNRRRLSVNRRQLNALMLRHRNALNRLGQFQRDWRYIQRGLVPYSGFCYQTCTP